MARTSLLRPAFERDRDYYRSLVRLALPIAAQNLIGSSLNLLDTIMVGRLGPTEIAAVGLANSIYFLLAVFIFGVSSGTAVFVAQYWGKRDVEGVRRATGLGILLSVAVSLVFAAVTISAPASVMRLFTSDTAVVEQGAVFLRRIAPSYPLTALSFLFYGSMRSTEHARLPLLSSTIALVVNTVLNYVLIYGMLGAPRMGVQGSATATLLARIVELAIVLRVVYGMRLPSAVRLRHVFRVERRFLGAAMRVSLPVVANEGLWALGYTVYPAVYARMGTDVIAAVTVFSTLDRLAFVLTIAMGNAAAAIIGKQIGAGRKDLAYRYGALSLVIAPLTGIVMGCIVFFSRPFVLPWFDLTGAVLDNAMLLVALGSATLVLKSFSVTAIIGVLRAGGDTLMAMLLDIGAMWTVAVPLVCLGGLVFHWPLYLVFLAANIDEVIKVAFSLARFLSRKWIRDLVNAPADAPPSIIGQNPPAAAEPS